MDESSSLLAVAEIAAALAGFSGVVTVLGGRDDEAFWTPLQRARFVDLLIHSGIALFASLVPVVVLHSVGSTPATWGTSSGMWAFFSAIGVTHGAVRHVRQPAPVAFDRLVGWLVLAAFAALFALQVVNAVSTRTFAPYLAALVGNLAFSFVQFMRLVYPWAPPRPARAPGSRSSAGPPADSGLRSGAGPPAESGPD